MKKILVRLMNLPTTLRSGHLLVLASRVRLLAEQLHPLAYAKWYCVGTIDFYQKYISFDHGLLNVLAPGGACKYELTCSEYTKQAIARFGVMQGLFRGLKRVLTCR